WRSATEAERAAQAMKLAGPDLLETGVVDALIKEPDAGAHTDHDATGAAIKTALVAEIDRISRVPIADLLSLRYERFRAFGTMVGIFNAGREWTAGDEVKRGDVLGGIQSLGHIAEISAPADGEIREVLVAGGAPVEYGQPLFVIALR